MIGSPLTSAHRLREGTLNLMWQELNSKLSRKYSSMPFHSHVTQVFVHLQQGLEELLKMYLHSFLSKIHHTLYMSQMSVEGLNNYTVVYGLNSRNLRESITGHWSMQ